MGRWRADPPPGGRLKKKPCSSCLICASSGSRTLVPFSHSRCFLVLCLFIVRITALCSTSLRDVVTPWDAGNLFGYIYCNHLLLSLTSVMFFFFTPFFWSSLCFVGFCLRHRLFCCLFLWRSWALSSFSFGSNCSPTASGFVTPLCSHRQTSRRRTGSTGIRRRSAPQCRGRWGCPLGPQCAPPSSRKRRPIELRCRY